MENRNLDKALDIVSKLITGENVSERGENAALYQEYNNNAEVYDIVHMSLKKLNLNIYEYNNGLYVSAGDNNRVFGYSNEELRNVLGLRVNKELYLAYFIIYNIIRALNKTRFILIFLWMGKRFLFHVRKPKNCWHFWLTEEEDL